MPRSVEITVPPERTEQLVAEIGRLEGLVGLRVLKGASVRPPGDVLSLEVTTPALHKLMAMLDRHGVGEDSRSGAVTSHPLGVVSAHRADWLAADSSEAIWEEMELTIGLESNMTANGLLLMTASGILAAIGIGVGALDLVIGAMIIGPGFEPICRVSLGLVAANRSLLTSGVMIALALVPAAAVLGMSLALGDTGTAAGALVRWAVDVGGVLLLSALVFAVKRATILQRKSRL